MVAAMAVGATAAAAYSVINASDTAHAQTVLAAGQSAIDGGAHHHRLRPTACRWSPSPRPPAPPCTPRRFAKAAAFAQERAEREARLQRPLFVMPTNGVFTSGFGYRWGVLHGGIDIANSIGTPIYAVADGVVIDAGPTAGYGAWVKLRHADGTVTLYGHVNTWLVSVGQRVMAGDQIATIGNRGNSTGPHCHFEVLLNGTDRIDPRRWLAQRGHQPRQLRSADRVTRRPPAPSRAVVRRADPHHPHASRRALSRSLRTTPAPASSAAPRPGPSRPSSIRPPRPADPSRQTHAPSPPSPPRCDPRAHRACTGDPAGRRDRDRRA